MLKRSFLLAVAAVSLVVAMATVLWVAAFWHRLSAAEEALFVHVLFERFAGILLAAFFLMVALAILLGILLHRYLIPLRRLVEETTVIATVNASHRISARGAKDIVKLAQAINDGAVRFQNLERSISDQIRNSKQKEMEERNMLASVICRLKEGILLCRNDGSILLYNVSARRMFSSISSDVEHGNNDSVIVGLGRSVFDILGKKRFQRALAELNRQQKQGEENPVYDFKVETYVGEMLRIQIFPLIDAMKKESGFIITCYDVDKKVIKNNEKLIEESSFESQEPPSSVTLLAPLGSSGVESGSTYLSHTQRNRPEFYDFDLFRYPKRKSFGWEMRLSEIGFTAFDTETTGLDPLGGDEIISIGAVRIFNGRVLESESFDQLVETRRLIKGEAIRVHGIVPEMLSGQPTIDKVLPVFRIFVGDTVLVGHNVAFDMRFLQLKEEESGVTFNNPVLDTLLLSVALHPNQEDHSLEAIAERLGLNVIGRHSALGDAILTANIFSKMIKLLNNKKIRTLEEAIASTRNSYYARLKY